MSGIRKFAIPNVLDVSTDQHTTTDQSQELLRLIATLCPFLCLPIGSIFAFRRRLTDHPPPNIVAGSLLSYYALSLHQIPSGRERLEEEEEVVQLTMSTSTFL